MKYKSKGRLTHRRRKFRPRPTQKGVSSRRAWGNSDGWTEDEGEGDLRTWQRKTTDDKFMWRGVKKLPSRWNPPRRVDTRRFWRRGGSQKVIKPHMPSSWKGILG